MADHEVRKKKNKKLMHIGKEFFKVLKIKLQTE